MNIYISALLFLFFVCQPGYIFSAQFIPKSDSLLHAIETLSHDDTLRLSALKDLARIEQSTDKGLELATELLHEAQRLKSDRYTVFGGYYSLIYHFNHQNLDSIAYFSDIILPIAEKEKIWVVYFDVLKIQTNSHSIKEDFELAINNALKMRKKAKAVNFQGGIVAANMCLGTAYIGSERWEEGQESLLEAYEAAADTENILVTLDVLGMLIPVSLQMKNYPDVYKYLDVFKTNLNNYLESAFNETTYTYYAFIEIYYGYYHIRTGNPEAAFAHLMKARELLNSNNFIVYKLVYRDAMSEYYHTQKDYQQALAYLDSNIHILKNISPKEYYTQLVQKANILIQTGKLEEALSLYQTAIAGKDSLSRAISIKQLEQLQKIYDLNNLQIEKEKIKNQKQNYIFLFTSIIAIFALLFMLRTIFVRKQLKKAEEEMRKAAETVNEANQIKDKFLSNLSYNIRAPLNNVVGFSQLMSADPDMDEEQRKEYGAIVKKNSEELIELVNNVLDLSRLESGMMKFNVTTQTLDELCTNVQYMVKSKHHESISLLFENKTEEEKLVTDSFRFTQLLLSTLTFPVVTEKQHIAVCIEKDTTANCIRFTISGSPLANPAFARQETIIQNEINRLFIEHFQGTYQINPPGISSHAIVFTYPVS